MYIYVYMYIYIYIYTYIRQVELHLNALFEALLSLQPLRLTVSPLTSPPLLFFLFLHLPHLPYSLPVLFSESVDVLRPSSPSDPHLSLFKQLTLTNTDDVDVEIWMKKADVFAASIG